MRNLLLGFALLAAVFQVSLQGQLTLSPYSRYGLGELTETNSIRNYSMGGISAAVFDWSTINRLNPASYADIRLTTLDFSGYLGARQQKTSVGTGSTINGGVYNVSYAFSNNKGFGFAFGLGPESSVGYNLSTRDSLLVDTTWQRYTTTYQAGGGLNHFYIGTGVRFFKSVRAGVNFTYNFGTIDYNWATTFDDNSIYQGNIRKRISLGGWTPQVGIQFGDTIKLKHQVDQLRDLENQMEAATRELEAYQREEAAIKAEQGSSHLRHQQKNQAAIDKLKAEQQALRKQIEVLMKNEADNDKEIGKLQDHAFRIDKKIRKREKSNRAADKELNIQLEKARSGQAKAKATQAQITKKMEDVKAGTLSATVEKRHNIIARVGGTAQPSLGFSGTRLTEFNNTLVVDSAGPELSSKVQIPIMYTAGFTLSRPTKWMVGADIRLQNWSTFNMFNETNNLGSSMRVSVGGEFIPDYYDQRFSRRIAYRLGGYYHNSQIVINNEALQEYGITLGAGLPIGRFVNETQTASRLNLGISIGRSGNLNVQPLEETTIRFMLGVNLNDVWFRKWRLD